MTAYQLSLSQIVTIWVCHNQVITSNITDTWKVEKEPRTVCLGKENAYKFQNFTKKMKITLKL